MTITRTSRLLIMLTSASAITMSTLPFTAPASAHEAMPVNDSETSFPVLLTTAVALAGSSQSEKDGLSVSHPSEVQSRDDADLERYRMAERIAAQNLATFDALDFHVFSNQDWDRLKESHGPDVKVHWPDGHVTNGIERHIADLKNMFTYAPDTRIKVHPIKLGDGAWTAVVGIMEGTFTASLTTPDGTVIQPTGKSFRLPMATVSHWADGVMDEEYLFWDNQSYVDQLGIVG